jgi:hypothetical protein
VYWHYVFEDFSKAILSDQLRYPRKIKVAITEITQNPVQISDGDCEVVAIRGKHAPMATEATSGDWLEDATEPLANSVIT